ncbi:MAG: tRNA uridine(34) 5-carboxymethylaminomethyl synthesis GTPase MnmE [Phycisphaerales bacterium]|nr:tRNA uridine(34) 5-carboxymethylaminomethyl synthesis GTPase MnmE [Phycisphaerales bacterium]
MISGDTIAAISSAVGTAARMVVRVSGPEAWEHARRLWVGEMPAAGGATRGGLSIRRMRVPGWVYCFRSPRSYTGEDLVEFHIPGNPLLAKMLLEDLLGNGARSAGPGEFTARAYFNGRLDLTQAEGVAATISAGSEQELSAARRLMAGELARRLAPVTDLVAQTLALLEVGIDFSDEDVSFLSPAQAAERIAQADGTLTQLLAESVRFERLAHEPRVVLVGRPNAGKSTLLNALAGHERAVVSPVAGTTRDVLWAHVPLARGLIRLIDVAGLEETPDDSSGGGDDPHREIEQRMREHALRCVEEADHIVLMVEARDERPPISLPRAPALTVASKIELHTNSVESICGAGFQPARPIAVSAHTGSGIPALREALDRLCFGDTSAGSAMALNARHVRAIDEARESLSRAAQQAGAGPELLALELREALDALGGISGRISPDDLLGRIFSTFCIGK